MIQMFINSPHTNLGQDYGTSPLNAAIKKADVQTMRGIISKGAKLTSYSFSDFFLSQDSKVTIEMLELLLASQQLEINHLQSDENLLSVAIQKSSVDVVGWLFSKGAKLPEKFSYERLFENKDANALLEIVKLFVTYQPKEIHTLKDSSGTRLLHFVIEKGNKEAALYLIQNGANPYIPDQKGMTAFELANKKGLGKLEP